MKKSTISPALKNGIVRFSVLLFMCIGLYQNLFAQQLPECDPIVPFFTLDLSSDPDSIYTTPEIVRQGQCCGGAGNQNYVSFYVTLHPDVAQVEIGIAPGYADPGGSGNYNIITGGDLITPGVCGPDIDGGQQACIAGSGPHKLTYHKPGSNKVKYFLKQIPKPIYPADDTTRVGCSLPLEIFGLDSIVITSINSSTGNTTPGAYNGLLSCTNCATPSFSPGLGTPEWIDYQICGTPQASACGVFQSCDTIRLYTRDELTLSVSPNPGEFCIGGSVLLTATAGGGDEVYEFNWYDSGANNVSTSNTFSASVAGTYTAEVLDGLISPTCPAEYVSVPVIEGQLPTADAGPDQTVCATDPDIFLAGSVQNATGGTWSGGGGTYDPSANDLLTVYSPTQSEIAAGFVELILSSTGAGGGCPEASDTVVIYFSDTVVAAPSYATVICHGDQTTINANASGGTAPYTYAWSTGAITSSIVASAGTYSVTVDDVYGCSVTTNVTVSEPPVMILTMSSTNTSTDVACDGTATVNIVGGVAPYTIEWMDAQSTATATGLCYGIATVTVTDANGCVSTGSVVVNNPTCSAFNVTASNTDVLCYGDSTAQAFSFPTGGTPPYTYSWNTIPVQTTQNASGLGAGTYTVTVTDDLGCIDVATVTVIQPTDITNVMTHMDATTIGGSDGSATANPMGGTPGYTYLWNPTAQVTQTATGLSAGVYYVNILDDNSCLKVDSVLINQPPCNDFTLGVNVTDVSCNGADDGSAFLVIAQGTPPYSIMWSSGEMDVMSVSGLAAGSYTVTVTDNSNCTTFKTFDVTEPDELTLGLAPTDITCFGADDGTIDLAVSGGTFPYSFEWTMGGNIIAMIEDQSHLGPGTYSVEVTDDNGCTAVGSAGITEPVELMATFETEDVLCNGDMNGSVDVTVSGGILPYSYSWTGPGGFTSSNEDISGLDIGLYELQITDGNNCSMSQVLQSFINEPAEVVIELFTVPCPAPGADQVEVFIDSISGGAGEPYSVSFDGGVTFLPPGTYSLIVPLDSTYSVVAKDSNECNAPSATMIVVNPKVEIADISFNPCIAPGTSNINITVTPSGGDGGPYEVSTDGGSSFGAPGNYVISVPVGDNYTVVIRDASGCESMGEGITVPSPFDASAVLTAEVSCPGVSDGSIDLTITGGTSPYTISWSGPGGFVSSSEDISGLFAGNYDFTVTDDSGCVVNKSIEVTTIPDVTPPVITFCPSDASVSSDPGVCTYTQSGTGWDATATDNCLVSSIVYSLSGATSGSGTSLDGVVFNLGTTTVTWTVTDGSGNISTCSFDITVIDDQLPGISSCGASGDQNVVADNGVCTYTHSGTAWDATATDNCSVSSIMYSLSGATSGSGTSLDGVVFNLGTTTVTWTVTDGSGNVSTCSFDVIVADDQAPGIISCGPPEDPNVFADNGVCTYTHNGTGWDATAMDNCSISSINYSLSGATTGSGTSLDGVVFNLGTTTVTWTVTDGSGNISTCSFDVIVMDDQAPSISSCGASGDQTVDANTGLCTYTHEGTGWDASATDNCSISSIVYSLSGATTGSGTSLDGVVFNLGTTTVTWTVTDGSGNISTCSFDVIVEDNQMPEISSCGPNADQTVDADNGLCTYTHSGSAWDATATDNCSISSIIYTLTGATTGSGTSLDGVVFNLGTTTVTWTVTDGSGNVSTCSFDVIVEDNQMPAISSCGASGDQTVDADNGLCTYTHSGNGWDATATDNCSVSTIIYTLSGATTGSGTSLDGVVFNLGTTTVTWTVTDGSGNVSTCSFDVIVEDNQVPGISSCGASGDQTVSTDFGLCTYMHTGNGWDAMATDNCSVSSIVYTLSGATFGSGTSLDGVVFNLGTTTVTWTVTDGSGNVSTCTFDVIVEDNQLPAITSCGPSGPQTVNADFGMCTYTYAGTGWDAIATDNCTVSSIVYSLSGATSGSGTSLNGVVFNLGTTLVTWTVTDGSGNSITCSFTVTVEDDQDPILLSCGAVGTQNVTTDQGVCTYTHSGNGWDATATDNCSVASIIYTLSGATAGSGTSLDGVTFGIGTTTVLWTITDGSGNTETCTYDVIVTDNEVPSIIGCLNDIQVNTDQGDCGAIVNWIPPTFQDNCGASMVSTHNPGDNFPVGTTTVTYTVTDNSGNVSICTFDVIVTDNEAPMVNCIQNMESCDPVVSFNAPTATDNCEVASIVQVGGPSSGSAFPVGVTTKNI